ncbi:MAG: hypothetical protein D6741_18625 [Planctomycetota bacterium]|nr:MAG: hypothetical protein D6741_18625 [Planctomycetota bacterium]
MSNHDDEYVALLDDFKAFLQERTPESYDRVRRSIAESDLYEPNCPAMAEALMAEENGNLEEMARCVQRSFPTFLLSPQAHMLLATYYDAVGNTEMCQFECEVHELCARFLMETGDGTQERPYRIMNSSDEYDIMMMSLIMQRLSQGKQLEPENPEEIIPNVVDTRLEQPKDGGVCEIITLDDGSEWWFDIQDILARSPACEEEDPLAQEAIIRLAESMGIDIEDKELFRTLGFGEDGETQDEDDI